MELEEFYAGKKVFITGHTGFKGSWMCQVLLELGAQICGYSVGIPTVPSLFELLGLHKHILSITGDIRDADSVLKSVMEFEPYVVFHLAAQPIVLEAYKNPAYTYETNVMGTVNLLEAVRKSETVKSVVNITTDKVYKNNEWCWGYREDDILNGFDPYSNSKSCSELVTSSYINSFFHERQLAVSTARAGNVIGGGDFSMHRILPDAYRAACENRNVEIRSPYSIRPYQHVLEPIFAYLLLAAKQSKRYEIAGCYNVGPDDKNCITTLEIAEKFCNAWGTIVPEYIKTETPHEAQFLRLDCSKIKSVLNWKPVWDIDEAVHRTVDLYKLIAEGNNIESKIREQIAEYQSVLFSEKESDSCRNLTS